MSDKEDVVRRYSLFFLLLTNLTFFSQIYNKTCYVCSFEVEKHLQQSLRNSLPISFKMDLIDPLIHVDLSAYTSGLNPEFKVNNVAAIFLTL